MEYLLLIVLIAMAFYSPIKWSLDRLIDSRVQAAINDNNASAPPSFQENRPASSGTRKRTRLNIESLRTWTDDLYHRNQSIWEILDQSRRGKLDLTNNAWNRLYVGIWLLKITRDYFLMAIEFEESHRRGNQNSFLEEDKQPTDKKEWPIEGYGLDWIERRVKQLAREEKLLRKLADRSKDTELEFSVSNIDEAAMLAFAAFELVDRFKTVVAENYTPPAHNSEPPTPEDGEQQPQEE